MKIRNKVFEHPSGLLAMAFLTKRVLVAVATGALLGILCIIGVGYRVGYDEVTYLFAI